jgi:hypothetical protein
MEGGLSFLEGAKAYVIRSGQTDKLPINRGDTLRPGDKLVYEYDFSALAGIYATGTTGYSGSTTQPTINVGMNLAYTWKLKTTDQNVGQGTAQQALSQMALTGTVNCNVMNGAKIVCNGVEMSATAPSGQDINNLKVDGTYTFTWSIPNPQQGPNPFYYYYTDPNPAMGGTTGGDKPDLQITAVKVFDGATEVTDLAHLSLNKAYQIKVSVKNNGANLASSFGMSMNINSSGYRSVSCTGFNSISSGETKECVFSNDPQTSAHTYTFKFYVDQTGAITESNENNNEFVPMTLNFVAGGGGSSAQISGKMKVLHITTPSDKRYVTYNVTDGGNNDALIRFQLVGGEWKQKSYGDSEFTGNVKQSRRVKVNDTFTIGVGERDAQFTMSAIKSGSAPFIDRFVTYSESGGEFAKYKVVLASGEEGSGTAVYRVYSEGYDESDNVVTPAETPTTVDCVVIRHYNALMPGENLRCS